MLQLKNVKKAYKTKSGEVFALNGVDLTFPSTGMVFITGKSGCGKTTLLNVIGGLDGVDQGEISIFGRSFSSFSQSEYDDYRNTFIGFIFQEYNLLPEFTVEKNIKIAMELQGSTLDKEELNSLLETVEISNLKNRKPNELSGGQRQRVAIARALIKKPHIIMADEPTGALDSNTGVQVFDILKKLSKDKLIIVVSHDQDFAEKYADRIIKLVDGQVVEDLTYCENEIQFNVSDSKDSFLVRNGAELNQKEKDGLAKAIKDKKKVEIIENLSYREKKQTGEVIPAVADGPVKFKKSKMKFKSSLALGVKSLGVKPLRLVFTILLSAIAFAVFGLFDTLANFSTIKVLGNLLKNSPYPSIVAYGQYIVDFDHGDAYDIKLTTESIEDLENKTGYTVKGIYDFGDNTNGFVRPTYKIGEIANVSSVTGGNYYNNTINGILEFSEQEVSSDGAINDFGYKLISGVYPTLTYYENQILDKNSYYNIAISSYLADSLFFYLNGTQLDGFAINKRDDLINKHITIKDMKFKIVGIMDCGEIPAKYDKIKTTTISDVETRMLVEDFNSYISSGAYKCIFVVDGFKEMYDSTNMRATLYNSGGLSWSIKQSDVRGRQAEPSVYSVDDYNQDNVLLFSGQYEDGKKISLKDNEVIIHTDNLKILYCNQYENVLNNEDRIYANALITKIQDLTGDYNIEDKKGFLAELLTILCPTGNVEKEISATKSSSKTDTKITKNIKVVGIYFGIESNRITNRLTYRFMMNDNLMKEFGIYTEQGEYSKLLVQVNGNSRGTRYLSNLMTNESGFALNWYGNSSIKLIKENEETIKQSANLFLYAALVLALFSVFMFFNYLVTSIVNKRQSIGVLRGLGSGRKDIFRMFICESIIIALINATLATIITAVGCIFVNMYINNVMNIAIPFAIFGARQALLIFAVSTVTGIVSSILPIIKISKEKPVDLIRKP